MSLLKHIMRMIRSNKYEHDDHHNDTPPEYEEKEPPPSYDEIYQKVTTTTIQIENIINNIRNNKYNLGCAMLTNTGPCPSAIIRYLIKNYHSNKDIMLFMIKNNKHNNIIKIGKNKEKINTMQNKIFLLGSIDLCIQINNKILNFTQHKCGIFSSIYIDENGWKGNAIHNIGLFDGSASIYSTIVNIENFIKVL
jgi:hypothetical protein